MLQAVEDSLDTRYRSEDQNIQERVAGQLPHMGYYLDYN